MDLVESQLSQELAERAKNPQSAVKVNRYKGWNKEVIGYKILDLLRVQPPLIIRMEK